MEVVAALPGKGRSLMPRSRKSRRSLQSPGVALGRGLPVMT